MKTLLALLLLIPSLSWGDNIFNKIPSTEASIKKLYNYEIGYKFKYEEDDFYMYGNFDSLVEKNTYIWIDQDSIAPRAFRLKKSKEDIILSFDKNKTITGIRQKESFYEFVRKLKELTKYETEEHLEKYIPYGKCYDELQRIKKAIKLKLNINDKFLDTYQYFPNAIKKEPILAFTSTIKSKLDNTVLRLSCYYLFDEDLTSEFYTFLYDDERYEFMNQRTIREYPEMISKDTLIDKERFKEIFEILKSDVYELIKGL